MSVPRPDRDDKILAALKNSLGDFLPPNDPLRDILTGTQPGDNEGLRKFGVELQDIAVGNWRRNYTGWRFLAVSPAGDGIVVDVSWLGRIAGVQRGPHVGIISSALRAVKAPPDAAGDLELAFLNVPGLVESFWVKSKNDVDDRVHGWVVPFQTRIRQLDSSTSYRVEDLFANIKPIVERRLHSSGPARNRSYSFRAAE
jgi:hypothetical protein